MMTPEAVRAQIEGLVVDEGGIKFVGYGEEHAWTHKSGLERLPYHDHLLLPHNCDMMHSEKNIAEGLFGTLMDTDKSKDNVKARVDVAELCDRPNLCMKAPAGRKNWRRPKADFMLSRPQRKEVLEWFQTLMFHDGYASNWKRGVNLTTL